MSISQQHRTLTWAELTEKDACICESGWLKSVLEWNLHLLSRRRTHAISEIGIHIYFPKVTQNVEERTSQV